MQRPWMAIVLAAALNVSAGAALAAAQTVTVINAPPNSAIDVVFNATPAASGVADAAGAATLKTKMQDAIGKTEIDANVFVDYCGERRRVLIVEVGAPSAPVDAGCDRRQISGLYWVRPVNTVVVNLAGLAPTLLLIKGSYDVPAPNVDGTTSTTESNAHSWTQPPKGLVFFGSAGLSKSAMHLLPPAATSPRAAVTIQGSRTPGAPRTGSPASWRSKGRMSNRRT